MSGWPVFGVWGPGFSQQALAWRAAGLEQAAHDSPGSVVEVWGSGFECRTFVPNNVLCALTSNQFNDCVLCLSPVVAYLCKLVSPKHSWRDTYRIHHSTL